MWCAHLPKGPPTRTAKWFLIHLMWYKERGSHSVCIEYCDLAQLIELSHGRNAGFSRFSQFDSRRLLLYFTFYFFIIFIILLLFNYLIIYYLFICFFTSFLGLGFGFIGLGFSAVKPFPSPSRTRSFWEMWTSAHPSKEREGQSRKTEN